MHEVRRVASLVFPSYFVRARALTPPQLYLWPFAEAVKAGVGAVMCSYNKINQTQACQNSKLMNGALKEELGFMGAFSTCIAFLVSFSLSLGSCRIPRT
jgi:hypothetical protein